MERSSSSEERQYTLQELADSAGVSIRTIRYYIGEGLLPGPAGSGPQSHYTESHRKRLRAISLLKERFLPLREIRRELAGLDDAAIDHLISELDDRADDNRPPIAAAPMTTHDPAFDYIESALVRSPVNRRALREERTLTRAERPEQDERWRRIEIADGVELLIREDLYRRRRDYIDWLADWAEKVVD